MWNLKISQNKYCYIILLLYQNKVAIYTEPSFWMSTVEISIVLENTEILPNSWFIFLYGSSDSCLEWVLFSFFALTATVLTEAFMVHIYQIYKKSLHAFLYSTNTPAYILPSALLSLWPESIIYFYFYVYTLYCGKIWILEAE